MFFWGGLFGASEAVPFFDVTSATLRLNSGPGLDGEALGRILVLLHRRRLLAISTATSAATATGAVRTGLDWPELSPALGMVCRALGRSGWLGHQAGSS